MTESALPAVSPAVVSSPGVYPSASVVRDGLRIVTPIWIEREPGKGPEKKGPSTTLRSTIIIPRKMNHLVSRLSRRRSPRKSLGPGRLQTVLPEQDLSSPPLPPPPSSALPVAPSSRTRSVSACARSTLLHLSHETK